MICQNLKGPLPSHPLFPTALQYYTVVGRVPCFHHHPPPVHCAPRRTTIDTSRFSGLVPAASTEQPRNDNRKTCRTGPSSACFTDRSHALHKHCALFGRNQVLFKKSNLSCRLFMSCLVLSIMGL